MARKKAGTPAWRLFLTRPRAGLPCAAACRVADTSHRKTPGSCRSRALLPALPPAEWGARGYRASDLPVPLGLGRARRAAACGAWALEERRPPGTRAFLWRCTLDLNIV